MTFRQRCTLGNCGENKGHYLLEGLAPKEYPTAEAAKADKRYDFEVVEVTWALRFFGDDGKAYAVGDRPYVDGAGDICEIEHAARYQSLKAAREALTPSCYSFAGGPEDLSGWRAMRRTKVVK